MWIPYADEKIDSVESDVKLRGILAFNIICYKLGLKLQGLQEKNHESAPVLHTYIEQYYATNEHTPGDWDSLFDTCDELTAEIRKNGDKAINDRLDELIDWANKEGYKVRLKEFFKSRIEDRGMGLIPKEEVKRLAEEHFEEFEKNRENFNNDFAKEIVRAWFLENYERKEEKK